MQLTHPAIAAIFLKIMIAQPPSQGKMQALPGCPSLVIEQGATRAKTSERPANPARRRLPPGVPHFLKQQ
jgi:hypothetical protein